MAVLGSMAGRLFGARRRRSRTDPCAIDLSDPRVTLDPFPAYERLRDAGPVVFLPRHGAWIVLSHAAMQEALSLPDRFSSAPHRAVDDVLLAADPPGHDAVRRLMAPHFTGERLRSLEVEAERIAGELIKPRLDAVAGFGLPLSRRIAASIIGFERDALEEVLAADDRPGIFLSGLDRLIEALDRAAGRSRLFRHLNDGGAGIIDGEQARSLVRLTWIAGTTTTERAFTRCVLHMLAAPGLEQALRDSPSLLPRLIEESLRLNPPEHLLPRRTTRACALAGVRLPEGALVYLCTSAANRDPARYEAPAELRLGRSPADHLAFGAGIHLCLGAPLTRRVVRGALATLLHASERLSPAQSLDAVPYLHTMATLTPLRLEIALHAPR